MYMNVLSTSVRKYRGINFRDGPARLRGDVRSLNTLRCDSDRCSSDKWRLGARKATLTPTLPQTLSPQMPKNISVKTKRVSVGEPGLKSETSRYLASSAFSSSGDRPTTHEIYINGFYRYTERRRGMLGMDSRGSDEAIGVYEYASRDVMVLQLSKGCEWTQCTGHGKLITSHIAKY